MPAVTPLRPSPHDDPPSHPAVLLNLLGGFELAIDGEPCALRYAKSKAVLAQLRIADAPLTRHKVANQLWPQLATDRAKANLRVVLAELRSALGAVLAIDRHSIGFAPGVVVTSDLDRWFALYTQGVPQPLDHEVLRFAAVPTGDFLEGLGINDSPEFEAWVRDTQTDITTVEIQVLTALVESLAEGHESPNLTALFGESCLQTLQKLDPSNESALRLSMVLMERGGRSTDALALFRNYRQQFGSIGMPHEPETIDVAVAISDRMTSNVSSLVDTPVPMRRALHTTTIIGRDEDLAHIEREFLDGRRLVTVTGMGGVGKSTLARAFAQRVVEAEGALDWGVEFVDLSGIDPGDDLAVGSATALGIPLAGLRPAQDELALALALAPRQMLVIFDTGEHVTGPLSTLVLTLLHRCPELRILVTSRVPLRIGPECVLPLDPLPVPSVNDSPSAIASNPAVRLMVERARAIGASVDTDAGLSDMAEASRQLEGIPLALELAATRLRLLSPSELAATLEHNLDDLADNSSDRPRRHLTLRRSIEWSYRLLDEEQRRTLQSLSVFRHGAPVTAVAALLERRSQGWPALLHLVDASLVQRERASGGTRLMLADSTRAFAREQLVASGDSSQVERRHAQIFLTYAEQADAAIRGPEQLEWLARLDVDHDNLRAAFDAFASTRDVHSLLRMTNALGWFWHLRHQTAEGRSWCDRASESVVATNVDTTDEPNLQSLAARADTIAAFLCIRAGDYQAAADRLVLARRGFTRCHDPVGEGELLLIAVLYHLNADRKPAINHMLEWIQRSTRIAEAHDATWDVARRQYTEAWLWAAREDYTEVERCGRLSLDGFTTYGDQRGAAVSTLVVAIAQGYQGSWSDAIEMLPAAFRTLRLFGDLPHCLFMLCFGGAGLGFAGQYPLAARLYGAAHALMTQTGLQIPVPFQELDADCRQRVQSNLTPHDWQNEWDQGAREGINVEW